MTPEQTQPENDPVVVGFRLGLDAAIMQARSGNLRLAAMPWEKDEYPHVSPIHPWRITRLAGNPGGERLELRLWLDPDRNLFAGH